ncbi:hypothetical protein HPQ32_14120 [Photobacterium carnosum]|uniref:hypothetical protein n=1 Tax=Photobacterium carnosum TaxID=2023717 RepID=UPI001C91F0E5|nr:hypothetical protein [Photobacterium carnosum]MBY3789559.1 hypothetical protein [Photobacterium carnosum]MCD9534618.1 hypothetical protein [Photobacterium carnosum]
MNLKKAILLGAIVITAVGCTEKSYDDCVINNLQGVDGKAVSSVIGACRNKFPRAKLPEKSLDGLQVLLVTGRAGLNDYTNNYSGSLYNGNNNITVKSVILSIKVTNGKKSITREYAVNITIPPLSTSDFNAEILLGDKGASYSWFISSAKGIPLTTN